MKTTFFLTLIILLLGCNENNPQPNTPTASTYTVKYEAVGNDDFYLFGIQNSTGGQDSYVVNANQTWTYEFQSTTGHLVGLSIDGDYGIQPASSLFSLKIYLNGVLWKEANGAPDISIMANLP